MNGKHESLTDEQLERFFADLRRVQLEKKGPHLTEEQFIAYTNGTLAPAERQRLDEHLDYCAGCADEMEQFTTALSYWNSAKGQTEINSLRKQLNQQQNTRPVRPDAGVVARLAETLRSIILLPNITYRAGTAYASTRSSFQSGHSEEGVLHWSLEQDGRGNLIVRLSSHHLELEGAKLELVAGERVIREVTLERVSDDEVGVETILSRNEREALPDVPLRVSLRPST